MGTTASHHHHSGSRFFEGFNCEITWSHSALQGKRESMEDDFSLDYEFGEYKSFFVSVFDGHRGKRAAQFASKHLHQTITSCADYRNCNFASALIYAYEELDKRLLDISRNQDWFDGTTSITTFLTQEDPRLYVANAGDCRAIVVLNSGKCYPLSRDHNPSLSSERKRVLKEGGVVKDGRIESQLSVSRGFGDRQFKEPKKLVIPTPDVISIPIDENIKFMIIACDGLWGWVSNLQAARFVNLHLKEGMKPSEISKELTKYAIDKGSSDNITVVVIVFEFKGEKSATNGNLWDIQVIDEKQKMMPFVKFHTEEKKDKTPRRRVSLDIIVDEQDNSEAETPEEDTITRRAHSIDLGITKVQKKEKKRLFIAQFKKKSSKVSKENGKKGDSDSKKSEDKKKSKNK